MNRPIFARQLYVFCHDYSNRTGDIIDDVREAYRSDNVKRAVVVQHGVAHERYAEDMI